jgi:hypothetical protein
LSVRRMAFERRGVLKRNPARELRAWRMLKYVEARLLVV